MLSIYKSAGERIYATRLMRGYTREELAELAEISVKFLFEIETGRKGFSAGVLLYICRALQVSCDYIMLGNETTGYDTALNDVLTLFNPQQTGVLVNILKEVHKLL